MELEAKSRGEQAPVKTSLASTQTNGTDLGEHHSSEERQEHKHGHEHGHKLGHHGHHAKTFTRRRPTARREFSLPRS